MSSFSSGLNSMSTGQKELSPGMTGIAQPKKGASFGMDEEDSETSRYFRELSNPPSSFPSAAGFGLTSQRSQPSFPRFGRSISQSDHMPASSMMSNFSTTTLQSSPSRDLVTGRPLSSTGGLGTIANPIQKRPTSVQPSLGVFSAGTGPYGNFGSRYNANTGRGGPQDNTPSFNDLSEFPSLSNRTNGAPQPQNSGVQRTPYVGMLKQPQNESNQEFQIQNEDFPALPGSVPKTSQMSENSNQIHTSENQKPGLTASMLQEHQQQLQVNRFAGLAPDKLLPLQQKQRCVQTTADGKVSNIPDGMVKDQFGIAGLLMFIRASETDPALASLALGSDLTTLGLNLNSPENLYPTFGGPWADQPCRPQDIDSHVPTEYYTNSAIRDKLAPIKLNRYGEDLLFYLFYMNPGDVLQLAAAAELFSRDWRYHKEEKVWMTRAQHMAQPIEKTPLYERGTYIFFDYTQWQKVPREFYLEYEKLEERPTLPNAMHPSPGPAPPPPPPSQNTLRSQN